MKTRFALLIAVWIAIISPAIVHARHHPAHGSTDGQAALWIIFGIIALVGIVAWLARKRK